MTAEPTIDAPLISARGARRRVQALHARGWMAEDLAPVIGLPVITIERVLWQATITSRAHEIIAAAYEVLWNATPPCSVLARQHEMARAAANGWVPPMAWDDIDTDQAPFTGLEDEDPVVDEVAVELAIRGEAVRDLTVAERIRAVELLHAKRRSDTDMAKILGVCSKTISKHRLTLGLTPVIPPSRPMHEAEAA